jgi:hypothetical protein
MKSRTLFLLGMIVGQALMVPYVWFWKTHPVVQVIPIPDRIFDQISFRKYEMYDVPHRDGGKRTLTVYLTSEDDVRALYKNETGEYVSNLMGYYNPEKHQIISVDSTDVLVHEMRHVFEGSFHIGAQEDGKVCN